MIPAIPHNDSRLDGGLLALRITAHPAEALPTAASIAPAIARHWLMRATVGSDPRMPDA